MSQAIQYERARPSAVPAMQPGPLARPHAAHYEAVMRVIELMHERIEEPLSLQDMSRVAFISQFHFNRVFRQVTGIPPHQYLYALRLETAKRLLLTTRESVTDVCFSVGYNSLGTFTRRFTGLVGISPNRFRAMMESSATALQGFASQAEGAAGSGHFIEGQATAPEDFRGTIFLGLFSTPIPQGSPIVGTVLTRPGSFRLPPAPDGDYYILGAGLPWSEDHREYLLYETALRGGTAVRVCKGQAAGPAHLALRAPTPFDPPILVSLPLLLSGAAKGAAH
ncbi:MAG TPA: AraC family transcriptional regulator [Pyrinomonadaceae bacterium]|jgi:AraC-like DNA-binding protein|nr:AraC family transcriptional regulator [Pyrinomonadaceae bacterium]